MRYSSKGVVPFIVHRGHCWGCLVLQDVSKLVALADPVIMGGLGTISLGLTYNLLWWVHIYISHPTLASFAALGSCHLRAAKEVSSGGLPSVIPYHGHG